ncbi:hypothetical protein GCM10023347_03850 [Streptomyces chumphonensis]|uniref:hypothetical protein n=1 Tax=Streptomyces chumphonensis TaxID=1214925 RepID=UPI001CD0C3B7|nr:hypothetical protein [Streptomyces chumphonensis]
MVSPLVALEIEHITTRNVDRRSALAVNDWPLAQERTDRRDFRAITPLTGTHAFRILPDDLSAC